VELIRGDMAAAGFCTVSYVDTDKVLACGHPIFGTGETYMPVATANVHTIVPSAMSAFVLASPAKEVGSLTQDRQARIAAETTFGSPMIPVSITVTSGSDKTAKSGDFHVEVLSDKFLTAQLSGAAVMNAINHFLPDRDDVTARVESSVKLKGVDP